MAEEDEERNKKNQVLDTLDRAYKTSVKKVEHLMEKHMDVSKDSIIQMYTYTSLANNYDSVLCLLSVESCCCSSYLSQYRVCHLFMTAVCLKALQYQDVLNNCDLL